MILSFLIILITVPAMNVAEVWQPPDWFASPAAMGLAQEPAPHLASSGLRILIVDGSDDDERRLLCAANAAGLDCRWEHWSERPVAASPAALSCKAALLFDAQQDLAGAARCLRALRADAQLAALPALLAVQPGQLSQLEAALGFDDFVLQPCLPLEVRARVRAVAQRRRGLPPASQEPSGVDGLQVDPVAHEARVDGRIIRMTAREFALFAYLRARPERVLTRQHLLERVWGYRYRGGPRTVDTHIGRLRLKFGDAFPIETVRSNGYRLRSSAPDVPARQPVEPELPTPEAAQAGAAQSSSDHAAE
jgi:DNA-binding response OmpR family regulator